MTLTVRSVWFGGKDIEYYFWNFRWWRMCGKGLDRLWSGSNISSIFLGISWKGERAYLCLV